MASCTGVRGRIVVVTNRIGEVHGETGGGSIMRNRLCATLEKEGYEVCCFSANRAAPETVETVRGPMIPWSRRNLDALWAALSNADMLIISGPYTPLLPASMLIASTLGVSRVFIMTADMDKAATGTFTGWRCAVAWQLYTRAEWVCMKLATRTYARSEASAKKLRALYGCEISGVMAQSDQYSAFYRPSAEDSGLIARVRHELSGGYPGRPLLLFVGRLIKVKRIEMLIAAKPPGMILAIVGDSNDEYASVVESFHDPRHEVVVHRRFADHATLRAYYWACDVHVSASDFETLGNTVHEAVLCGKPVVVQAAGGYLSQVNSGEQGFLVDYTDAMQVHDAIHAALHFQHIPTTIVRDITEGKHIVSSVLAEKGQVGARRSTHAKHQFISIDFLGGFHFIWNCMFIMILHIMYTFFAMRRPRPHGEAEP